MRPKCHRHWVFTYGYHLGFRPMYRNPMGVSATPQCDAPGLSHAHTAIRAPLSHGLTATHPACRTCVLRQPCCASSGAGNMIADLRHNLRVACSGLRYPSCIAGHQCDTLGLSHTDVATLQPCRIQLLRYTTLVVHAVCDIQIVPLEAV